MKVFQFDVVPLVLFCFVFAFVAFAWGENIQKNIVKINSKSVLFMFSAKCFMVSGLTLSLIHFEFIFIDSVRKQSSLVFCM